MTKILPFSCFRPSRSLVNKFVLRPSDFSVLERSENIEKLLGRSIYSITQPELFNKDYEAGKKQFSHLFRKGFIFPEINPHMYIYQIDTGESKHRGLVCAQQIHENTNREILGHEKTRERTLDYLNNRMSELRLNSSNIFSFFNDSEGVDETMEEYTSKFSPDMTFNTPDDYEHTIWKIDYQDTIDSLQDKFTQIPQVFLADGHHRLATLQQVFIDLNVSEEKRKLVNILFPASKVNVMAFARLIRDIDEQDLANFENKLNVYFEESVNDHFFTYKIYRRDGWKNYSLKQAITSNFKKTGIDYLKAFDQYFLKHIFGINDQRSDDRVLFFKDTNGPGEMERLVDKKRVQLAVRLKPITIGDIMQAAIKGIDLPPKSSLFEPKPRHGLFITQF